MTAVRATPDDRGALAECSGAHQTQRLLDRLAAWLPFTARRTAQEHSNDLATFHYVDMQLGTST